MPSIAPTLAWTHAGPPPSSWLVPLALGGEAHPMNLVLEARGDVTRVTPDAAPWRELRSNVAFWWTAFAVDRDPTGAVIRVRRAPTSRCVVRHESIARVEGSTLYGNAAQPMFRFSGATTTSSAARSASAGASG